MELEQLLDKYKEKIIKKIKNTLKKKIYENNNLDLIKKNFAEKFYGLRQALFFMDSFLKELKNKNVLKKSSLCCNDYKDGEVVVYDFKEKNFLTFCNLDVEDAFLKTYLEKYFILDKNELYIVLYKAILKAKTELNLNLVPNFMEIGNIVNWFLFSLRNQMEPEYKNEFFFEYSINMIPEVFLETSKEKHQELLRKFFDILLEEKVILANNGSYLFLDIENSIRLIYGNFDMFWFNNPDKEFIFGTNFELDDEIFRPYVDIDYSNDLFLDPNEFAEKIKVNNIIFGYVLSSMFCYLALHNFLFTNSLYSDFFIKKWLEKQPNV
jgi:hypothetical protein